MRSKLVNLTYFMGHVIFWIFFFMGHVILPVQSMHELCFLSSASEFARTELDMERQVHTNVFRT